MFSVVLKDAGKAFLGQIYHIHQSWCDGPV